MGLGMISINYRDVGIRGADAIHRRHGSLQAGDRIPFVELIAEDESKVLVQIDPKYFRPTEVDLLVGDPVKAAKELNWKPKITFKALVKEMVQADLADAQKGGKSDSGI